MCVRTCLLPRNGVGDKALLVASGERVPQRAPDGSVEEGSPSQAGSSRTSNFHKVGRRSVDREGSEAGILDPLGMFSSVTFWFNLRLSRAFMKLLVIT